jgi:hypothetical protein
MKSIILFLIIICLSVDGFSQGVGIGTTAPNSSAMLDVTSTNKGFLFPRMTYAQRIAIVAPTAGLLVYQTNSGGLPIQPSGVYFYDGSLWKRIARADELGSSGGTSGWTIGGDNQYSNLVGNVGIGTSSPSSKFHLVGNMLTESGSITINNPTAILQLQSAAVNKGFLQLSGNNVRIGTNSGNTGGKFIIRMNGLEHLTVDSTGYVGIGTSTPETQLQVDGPGYPSYTTNGLFQLGSVNEINMVFGRNEILTRSSGNPTALYLQQNGGKIYIGGAGGSDENPKVHIRDGSHASLVNADGHLLIGETDGLNMAIGHYEILARDNGGTSPLYLQQEGGAVRIGATGLTASGTRLHITDGASAGLATHGYLLLGLTTGENIVMDNNNIQARANGSTDRLMLNESGGAVQIGSNADVVIPSTKLYIPSGDDASLTEDGLIHLGREDGTNLIIDNNEIVARNNGAAAPLVVQNDGGSFRVGTDKLFVDTDGEVGIGTTNPLAKLDVDGRLRIYNSGEAIGIDGINPSIGMWWNGLQKFFIQQLGNDLQIGKTGGNPNGSIYFGANQIAINTSSPATGYAVSVGGKIMCEEVKVQLEPWPDYVFSDTYNAPSIDDYAKSIEENKHLPGMPNADEINTGDIGLGEIQRRMMEKIEEMSLFIIQQQQEIEALKESILELQNVDQP